MALRGLLLGILKLIVVVALLSGASCALDNSGGGWSVEARIGAAMCKDLGFPKARYNGNQRDSPGVSPSASPCDNFEACIQASPGSYSQWTDCYQRLAGDTRQLADAGQIARPYSGAEIAALYDCRVNGFTTASCLVSITDPNGCLHNGGLLGKCDDLQPCYELVRAEPSDGEVAVASLIVDRRPDITPAAGPTCRWQPNPAGRGLG